MSRLGTPTWKLVEGRNRCHRCSNLVERAWVCFTNLTTWTLATCEDCAETLTNGKD